MTTAERSLVAMCRTTATSWKPSTTATACVATHPLVITMPMCYVLKHIKYNM